MPSAPAIVCLAADEGLHELRVGERTLLPGECIAAPTERARGRLRAMLHVSGEYVARPGFRVRPGWRTVVTVDGHELVVLERSRCDGRVDEG